MAPRTPTMTVSPGQVRIVFEDEATTVRSIEIPLGGADLDKDGRLFDVELLSVAHRVPGLRFDLGALKAFAESTKCRIEYHPDVDILDVWFSDRRSMGSDYGTSDWGAGRIDVDAQGQLVALTLEADFREIVRDEPSLP